MKHILFWTIVVIASGCAKQERSASVSVLELDWTLSDSAGEFRCPGSVPGNVHQDLLSAGHIPDPYHGTNEDSVQWVGLKSWVYTATWQLSDSSLDASNVDLLFQGLDTYAKVYLNDSLILQTDNMFRSWTVPVRGVLRSGFNDLKVVFRNPIEAGAEHIRKYGRSLPADNDVGQPRVSPFVRKAGYHFGWDFSPRLVTSGIWKPINVRFWDKVVINDVLIDYEVDAAKVQVETRIQIECASDEKVQVRVLDDAGIVAHSLVSLRSGKQMVPLSFELDDPEMWWPNGAGSQALHTYRVEVLSSGDIIDERICNVGFRKVRLDRSKDHIGERFRFAVNDSTIFMKGANIVPPGILRGDANVQAWLELVEAARAANMNMLRVWGGGVYPPDEFYEACDTAGILVWQDIMFANEMVPGSSGFTTSVEKEVKEVARRFRGHPSLALWCGNNEVEVAWQNWGWQDKYIISASDSVRMWNDYRRLFRKKIPEWLQVVDPNTPYISSSPISNWGNKDGLLSGDLHYWGVFHGDEGIGDFKHNIGRFVSEYGMQSYPSVEVLKSLTDSDSYKYTSSFWLSRQKSYKSDNPILDGLVRRFWTPSGPDEFVRLGRLYQADCYKEAIEQHRFAKEHCDGTLFWQLNDVWPGASWATVEQDGSWKPAHYAAKEAFKPDLLRFGHNQDSLWVELLSDHGVYGGSVHIRLFLSNGRKLWERTIPAGSPRVGGWKHQIFNAKAGVNRRILFAEWRDENGVVLADNHFIWVPPGRFWQEDPTFTVVRKQIGRAEYYFGVAVNKPVLYVHLNPSGFLPSEDYFALPPDREKTIPTRAVKSKSSDIFVVPMSLTPERKGRTGKPLLFSGLRTTELTE